MAIQLYGDATGEGIKSDATGSKLHFDLDGTVRTILASGKTHRVEDSEGNIKGEVGEEAGSLQIGITYEEEGESFQPVAVDMEIGEDAGSADGADPKFLAPIMGNVLGEDLAADANYLGGLIGHYSVTGVKATTYPAGAVLGGIGDGVTEADGAFVAYTDGDSEVTKAGAAFKVRNNNSGAGSGFDFGVDLQDAAHDGYQAVDDAFYLKAPIRLVRDVVLLCGNGAPVDGAEGTGAAVAGPGSLYFRTSNGAVYRNTGSKAEPVWKLPLDAEGVTSSAAELNKLDGAGAVVASGTQAAVIGDPAGGGTTDAEARTAINSIIDALQAFGIVASV